MRRLLPRILALLLAASGFAAEVRAADPQSYKVDLLSTGNGAMDATLRATSDLVSLRGTAPVGPSGLIARARSDIGRLKTVLESYGYYQSSIAIQLDGAGLDSPGLTDQLEALPKKQGAKVQLKFTLGPLYHLRNITIDGELPEAARGALGLKSGDAAVAAAVLAAGDRLRTALGNLGFAFAKVDAPVAYEDDTGPLLDVTFHVETGEKVKIGRIHLRGLKRLHENVVRRRLLLHTGEPYNASALERTRADLLNLQAFSAVSVEVGSQLDESGGVPITFRLRERQRYAINLAGAYSTDLGVSGTVGWSDRNLSGRGDQFGITTQLLNAGGNSTGGLGYQATIKYGLPDFGHRDQTLQFSVSAIKQYLDAYDQTATTAGVSLVRKIDRQWTVSAGLAASNEKIIQVVGVLCGPSTSFPDPPIAPCAAPYQTDTLPQRDTNFYTLIQVPLTVAYDSTDLTSPLDDPTHGMRDSVNITPTHSLGASSATFLIDQLKFAGYFDLDRFLPTGPGRSILAARALVGVAQGTGVNSLPPDQRFYAGGSATIRGYPYQAVGPYFGFTGYPVGGTALVAAGLEYRQRLVGNFGTALFVDAGQISNKLNLLPGTPFIGVGTGLRYYTPIGPIRLDVAVPTKRYGDYPYSGNEQGFQVYIGLGQAF